MTSPFHATLGSRAWFCIVAGVAGAWVCPAHAEGFREFIDQHCAECHDSGAKKGGFDLSPFTDEAAVMKEREIWRLVYDKLESRQMPPPKHDAQPTEQERATMLRWIEGIAAREDPRLGARDPGKPTLRRLTRLEYNNAIRDLFELSVDVFMFPERLPIADKSYFQPGTGKLAGPLSISIREFGGKYPVLCPQLSLPGDTRAEHGFRNRGDVMDFTPLLAEQYLAAAGQIMYAPDLPMRSAIAADLLGIAPEGAKGMSARRGERTPPSAAELSFQATERFAPGAPTLKAATEQATPEVHRFRRKVSQAFADGVGGTFDSADDLPGTRTVPGKGAIARIRFAEGAKTLSINPDADLWLANFSTARATSGGKLLCNQTKGMKVFELTFRIEDGDEEEGVWQLGLCVLGRRSQSGIVSLTAKLTDGTETTVHAQIPQGEEGTRFVSFTAIPGESIASLAVDGSKFSGDYVLLDDLAFITNGQARPAGSPRSDSPATAQRPAMISPPQAAETRQSPAARLAAFIDRAFRRAVAPDEARLFTDLLQAALQQGRSEADAMRQAVAAVLASPQFLFIEANGPESGDTVAALEDTELATRLALFLWASIPDPELLRLAKDGRLRDPAVLEGQVRRMLRDPRSRELSESFATQWLRLDQLYTAKPDRDLFKDFYSGPQGKSTLHGAMLVESLLLFENVLIEDRSILEFIHADYTWLNPALAKLYGIRLEGEADSPQAGADTTRELKTRGSGPTWRRVALPDARRGGFLTMAGPLVVTSLPFRTSPVKRGAWLLETVFNRPPTEPKVAFAIENDTKEGARLMSIRQKFEAHRSKAACYSCHVRLDPPGFALERFDPIGQWREADGDQPVDARGDWLGQPFDGPAEFKAILLRHPREFTRGFIEHLLSYALGRRLEIYDMPAIAAVESAAQADDWKFSRIVVEIARSYPFTHTRRSQP